MLDVYIFFLSEKYGWVVVLIENIKGEAEKSLTMLNNANGWINKPTTSWFRKKQNKTKTKTKTKKQQQQQQQQFHT